VWVLVVEDEPKMAALLKQGLEEDNHTVTVARDGVEGLEAARTCGFDVIVLDIMLPRMDGFEVARRLRAEANFTPVVMLTARDAVPDIVKGLDIGADDFVTKPFSFSELLARLRAASRRGLRPRSGVLRVAGLALDPASHEVSRNGRKIALTPTEFRLLEFLMRRAGRVCTRSSIIEGVWNLDQEIESNTLDAFISLLRAKIDGEHATKLIHTARGFGYVVREE
jgi:two-component system response regulator MprA